jgi:hypothetical protein
MTCRARMESAETALYRAIAKRRDPATLKCCIDELVTAALAAGVEAERLRNLRVHLENLRDEIGAISPLDAMTTIRNLRAETGET